MLIRIGQVRIGQSATRRCAFAASLLLGGLGGAIGQVCDWQPLGTGVAPAAYACDVLANGDVAFGGSMTLAGSTEVQHIATWDGQQWHALGSGVNNFVRAIAAHPEGGLVAGGHFTQAGGQPAGLVARWDGTAWHRLGIGLDAGSCRALTFDSMGNLYAGGSFLQADNETAWFVAMWNGSTWSRLGENTVGGGVSGHFGSHTETMVHAIVQLPNGEIIVGGNFTHADGLSAPGIAIWNGSAWRPFGQGTNGVVRDMVLLASGDLVITGLFGSVDGVPARGIARWDGVTWHPFGQGLDGIDGTSPFALAALPDGGLVIGGFLDSVDGVPTNHVAMWDPGTDAWSPMGSGMARRIQTTVFALATDGMGTVYAGGQFESAGGNFDARNAAVFPCLAGCAADLTGDGIADSNDFFAYLDLFAAQDGDADITGNGVIDGDDFFAYLDLFAQGC